MSKKINQILDKVLGDVCPPKEDVVLLESSLKSFLEKFGKKLVASKIVAEIFIGGSFAKNSMIKKSNYDADVYVRFDKKYDDSEISKLTSKMLSDFKNVILVHGSRDYFQIKINDKFAIEIVPVRKVAKPSESENITDLSYSHVRYIKSRIKSKKLLDEIRLAKAFCYANHCYGAESYIRGFSGYSLELLIYHYGSFLKFIKSISKIKEKVVIDIEKQYKNKNEILLDLNGSKLLSPIVLIDPTYKQRNALAALSDETLEKFKKACDEFLKNPTGDAFELKKTDLEAIKKEAEKKKYEFVLVEAKTDRQEGDIAGSKLLKFYNHLDYEIKKFFSVKNNGFNYNGSKSARYFFVVQKKKEILIEGPSMKDKKNMKAFEKVHKDYFTRKGKLYAKELVNFSIKEFIEKWQAKNKDKIKSMSIVGVNVIE